MALKNRQEIEDYIKAHLSDNTSDEAVLLQLAEDIVDTYITPDDNIPAENASAVSTGIVSGGEITINAQDNTKFDVSSGVGFVGVGPIVKRVEWAAKIGLSVDNLATQFNTDIAIDVDGNVVQARGFTNAQLRELIFLGGLDHSNQTSILRTFSIQVPSFGVGNSLRELAAALGDINIEGNVFSANGTNLNINKTSGEAFSYGKDNLQNPEDPHVIVQPELVAAQFGRVFDDGTGRGNFSAPTTEIDPNNYDDGSGTLQPVPVNDWTIQRLLLFPNDNAVFVQYGSNTYKRLSDAQISVELEGHKNLDGITTAMVRGYLIVRQGTTNLNSSDTQFISADALGGLSAGSVIPNTRLTVEENTSTSYTFEITDENNFIQHNNASAITATIPTDAAVPFAIGTEIRGEQTGAGTVTLQGATGVTLLSAGNVFSTEQQYSQYTLTKVGTNEWRAKGGLTV